MTNTYTVTKSDESKGGAPRIYFDNKHNWQDAVYCGKVARPSVGMVITADMTSSEFPKGSGKMLWHLNAWKQVEGNKAELANASLEAPVASGSLPNRLASSRDRQFDPAFAGGTIAVPINIPARYNQKAGWNIDAGDLSRFVSNVVGSAIAANLIKTPTDLHPWIATAYSALQGLREGKPIDFQDKFDIKWTEADEPLPDPSERHDFDDDPGPDSPF